MQTDIIKVAGKEDGREAVLSEAEKFASYVGLDSRSAMRLRLIAEETLGLVNAIAGDFSADFWIEKEKDEPCAVHLKVKTDMDQAKKQEFIEASTDRKNDAAKGIMGKIREIIENGLYSIDETGKLQAEYGDGPVVYGSMGMCNVDSAIAGSGAYIWSLQRYRESVEAEKDRKAAIEEAWDELEKSVIANIADDVRVSISGSKVEMIIEKKFD